MGIDGGINEDGSDEGWLVVNLGVSTLRGSPRRGKPEYRIRGQAYGDASEIPLADPPLAGLFLRVDSTMPWSLCDPLVRWATEKRIPLRFALSKEDPNFWRERAIEIPIGTSPQGGRAFPLEDVAAPWEMAKGLPVRLQIPADGTAGRVIRTAQRLKASGATNIRFERLP